MMLYTAIPKKQPTKEVITRIANPVDGVASGTSMFTGPKMAADTMIAGPMPMRSAMRRAPIAPRRNPRLPIASANPIKPADMCSSRTANRTRIAHSIEVNRFDVAVHQAMGRSSAWCHTYRRPSAMPRRIDRRPCTSASTGGSGRRIRKTQDADHR